MREVELLVEGVASRAQRFATPSTFGAGGATDGERAVAAYRGSELEAVVAVQVSEEAITALHVVVDPEKPAYALAHRARDAARE
ncbi:hypothetical protein OHA40_28690 [Nocardia sp. NBC_00508]|uniref:hypothetical protein n=1 Tax=Nocardia sp. NBC_00508 TaxID=2975992 RepID=UPI002E81C1DA|nr:hypothetical protein [Nocardia sp. NBC_00508]WUD65557.1 hypothetical protein OHA40_28690 [Nocardia sp. NBC_00508]